MLRILSLAGILILSKPSWGQVIYAGTEVGNGGHAVVCASTNSGGDRPPAEQRVFLLDYFEAQTMEPIRELDLGPDSLSVIEKVKAVLSRLSAISPRRALRYSFFLERFFREAEFLSNVELTFVADAFHVAIPEGCHLAQLAIQRADKELLPGQAKYVINRQYWDRLSDNDKAGLILHEIIYREAITFGHNDSRATRYFNGLLVSKDWSGISSRQYCEVLKALRFNGFEYLGLLIDPSSAEFDDASDELLSARPAPGETAFDPKAAHHVAITGSSTIRFFGGAEPHAVQSIEPIGELPSFVVLLQDKMSADHKTRKIPLLTGSSVSFHDNGEVRKFSVAGGSNGRYLALDTCGKYSMLAGMSEFDADGLLIKSCNAQPVGENFLDLKNREVTAWQLKGPEVLIPALSNFSGTVIFENPLQACQWVAANAATHLTLFDVKPDEDLKTIHCLFNEARNSVAIALELLGEPVLARLAAIGANPAPTKGDTCEAQYYEQVGHCYADLSGLNRRSTDQRLSWAKCLQVGREALTACVSGR